MTLIRTRPNGMQTRIIALIFSLIVVASACVSAAELPPSFSVGSKLSSLTMSNSFHYEEVSIIEITKSGWARISFKRCTKVFSDSKSVIHSDFKRETNYERWIQINHVVELAPQEPVPPKDGAASEA
ncbi:MAG: hypothetical protein ACR2RV_16245 [Verrucomicrobiales bacterium]